MYNKLIEKYTCGKVVKPLDLSVAKMFKGSHVSKGSSDEYSSSVTCSTRSPNGVNAFFFVESLTVHQPDSIFIE